MFSRIAASIRENLTTIGVVGTIFSAGATAIAAGASMSSAKTAKDSVEMAKESVEIAKRSAESTEKQKNARIAAKLLDEYNDSSFTKIVSDLKSSFQGDSSTLQKAQKAEKVDKAEKAAKEWALNLGADTPEGVQSRETARSLRRVYTFYSKILLLHETDVLPIETMKNYDLPGIPRTLQFIDICARLYHHHPGSTEEPRNIQQLCTLAVKLGAKNSDLPACCKNRK